VVDVPVLGPDGGGRAALAVVFAEETAAVERVGHALIVEAEKVPAALR
jgi:hypothetical protein